MAFEIKRKRVITAKDLIGLTAFCVDYPMAKSYLAYGGDHEEFHNEISIIPFEKMLFQLKNMLELGVKQT